MYSAVEIDMYNAVHLISTPDVVSSANRLQLWQLEMNVCVQEIT